MQKQQLEAVFAGDLLDAYGAGSYVMEQSYFRDIVGEMSSAKKIEFVKFLMSLGIQIDERSDN